MKKLNVNLSSIVIGFLLGVSLMLIVGAKEYETPHYQIHSTRSADGGAVCFAVDTYKGMVWEYSGGTWHHGETLPVYYEPPKKTNQLKPPPKTNQ